VYTTHESVAALVGEDVKWIVAGALEKTTLVVSDGSSGGVGPGLYVLSPLLSAKTRTLSVPAVPPLWTLQVKVPSVAAAQGVPFGNLAVSALPP
jgi:hypothetical protein